MPSGGEKAASQVRGGCLAGELAFEERTEDLEGDVPVAKAFARRVYERRIQGGLVARRMADARLETGCQVQQLADSNLRFLRIALPLGDGLGHPFVEGEEAVFDRGKGHDARERLSAAGEDVWLFSVKVILISLQREFPVLPYE